MKHLLSTFLMLFVLVGLGSMIRLNNVFAYVSIDSYNYVMFHHWFILLVIAGLQLFFVAYFAIHNP